MSAEVSRITLLWHFEFVSPFAMHGGGSDLNKSSQRSGDKKKAQPGCCRKPHKGSQSVENTDACWVWSLDAGILCLHEWRCTCIRASKSAPGCVHPCMCSVFDKGEGLSSFNYSTVKTLHVHSRASHPTYPDTLLRGSSWRKQTKEDLDIPTSLAVPPIDSSSTTF